jgi:hypothetical protein
MSVRWISHVWRSSPYKGDKLLIHMALADFANDEGFCFPSQRTLAKKARTSEGYVRSVIKQMVKEGHVEIVTEGRGRGNTFEYRLLTLLQETVTEKRVTQNPVSVSQENRHSEEITPLIKNRHEPSLGQEFDSFWKAYPKKVARATAEKAFAKAFARHAGLTLADLLAGAERYARSVTDPKFIAYPATWLNGDRWLDGEVTQSAKIVESPRVQQARSLGAAFRLTRKTEAQLLDAIAGYEPDAQKVALDEYRSSK